MCKWSPLQVGREVASVRSWLDLEKMGKRAVSDVIHGRCTSPALVCTNSCGGGHGNSFGTLHDNSGTGVHANSRGTNPYGNSRVERVMTAVGE